MHLHEITLFNLEIGVNVTWNIAQYLLHYVNYAPGTFEVATSNG